MESAIDTGDTTWILISAALVMIMTPGVGFFYGGLVRSKNALATIMHSFGILGRRQRGLGALGLLLRLHLRYP